MEHTCRKFYSYLFTFFGTCGFHDIKVNGIIFSIKRFVKHTNIIIYKLKLQENPNFIIQGSGHGVVGIIAVNINF